MTHTTIRPACEADIRGIQAVGKAAWRDTYTGLVPNGYIETGMQCYWSDANFQQALVDPAQRLFVAERTTKIVGMCRMHRANDAGQLWQWYLLAEARAQGMGRALVVACATALGPGIQRFTTDVVSGNPAQQFYERLGFRVTHQAAEDAAGPIVFTYLAADSAAFFAQE